MRDPILEEDLRITAQKMASREEFRGSTVLVTGATGLVGSQIVKTLLMMNRLSQMEMTVLAMIRDADKAVRVFSDFSGEEPEFVVTDVTQQFYIEKKVDYIVHTASPTRSNYFVEHPVETVATTVDGTRRVLEFAREKHCKGVVYLSSMEAFGVTDPHLPMVKEEDLGFLDIHAVRSSYSEGKRVGELLCSCYAAEYQVPVRIARLAQTFGAGIPYGENRVFAQFAKSVIDGTDIVLHTTGMSVGNSCYTRDAVAAILLLLVEGRSGEAYTVANEASSIPISDMAHMVAERIAGGTIRVVYDIPEDQRALGYAPEVQMHLSSQKMQALGWQPEVGLEESYRRMIASMRSVRE